MITVAVIDDHPVVLEWFTHAVADSNDLRLVGAHQSIAAFDRAAGMRDPAHPRPDVLVLDLSLTYDQRDGAAGVAHLTASGLAVLVFSASEDREAVLAALQAGARGYVAKTASPSDILTAAREVAAGHHYVSPSLAAYLLRMTNSDAGTLTPTSREKQILTLIATGMTDREIAGELGISVRTVRSHLDNISTKIGQRRRAALASHAHRLGLASGQDSTGPAR